MEDFQAVSTIRGVYRGNLGIFSPDEPYFAGFPKRFAGIISNTRWLRVHRIQKIFRAFAAGRQALLAASPQATRADQTLAIST